MAPRDDMTSDFFMLHKRQQFSSRDIVQLGDHNNTINNINNTEQDNLNTTMTTETMNDVNRVQIVAHTGGDDDGLDTIVEEDIIGYTNNNNNNSDNVNNESFIEEQSHININDISMVSYSTLPSFPSLSSSITVIPSTTSEYNSDCDLSFISMNSAITSNNKEGDNDEKFDNKNINVVNSSTPGSVVNIDTILHDLKSIADDDDNHNSPVLLSSVLPYLNTPYLKAVGCHLILRHTKKSPPQKKVTIASNIKILRFLADAISSSTTTTHDDDNDIDTLRSSSSDHHHHHHHYCHKINTMIEAAETLQSLTAVEATDRYLIACEDLPSRLARCAAAAVTTTTTAIGSSSSIPLKASLHACIALMNLSCGDMENKRTLVSYKTVLESLRDLLLLSTSLSSLRRQQQRQGRQNDNDDEDFTRRRRVLFYMIKIRARAMACLKNLTYSDETHDDVLRCHGLIKALILTVDKNDDDDDEDASKNALLAIVELTIPARNKMILFQTEGLMEVLMRLLRRQTVTTTTTTTRGRRRGQQTTDGHNHHDDTRMMACMALVNLANGRCNRVAMYKHPGFVDLVVNAIKEESSERSSGSGNNSNLMNKALGILWNFAAEVKNQALMIQRHDITPLLVSIANNPSYYDSEPITKCLSTLTLLTETSSLAPKLYNCGVHIMPLRILHNADPDPHRWAITSNNNSSNNNNSNTTAPSRSLGLLLNLSQNSTVARHLRTNDDVLSLLSPYLNLSNHYQGLKAAMTAINLCCRRSSSSNDDDERNNFDYEILRRVERTVPKIQSLLVNTLAGRGGKEYEYGVFQLRSPLGCLMLLASYGPEFTKDMIMNRTVFCCLVKVLEDYCYGTDEEEDDDPIVGGGRNDAFVASLAVETLFHLVKYLIPVSWMASEYVPLLDEEMVERLLTVLECFEMRCCCSSSSEYYDDDCGDDVVVVMEKKYVEMARETQCLILGGRLKRIRMEDGGNDDDDEWKKRKVMQQQQQEEQMRRQSRRMTRKRKQSMVVVKEENDVINKRSVDKS